MGMKQTDTTISKVMAVTRAMAPKDVTTDELVILLDERFSEVQVRNAVVNYLGRQRRRKRRATVAYDASSRTVSWIGPTGRKTTVAVSNEAGQIALDLGDERNGRIGPAELLRGRPTPPTSEDVIAIADAYRDREDYPPHAEPRDDGTWEADDEPYALDALDALGDDTLPRDRIREVDELVRQPKRGDPGHRDHLSSEARAEARRKMLITNRLTRVERLMEELGGELRTLMRDTHEWREKAQRYDELERKFWEM